RRLNEIMASTKPSILVLSNRELPPNIQLLKENFRVEISSANLLREQLARNQVLYIWDYFWDRQTDKLREAWSSKSNIDWVHIANVGIDKINFPELTSSVRFLTNSKGVYERPIAEYVLGAYFFFLKRFRKIDQLQKEKTWKRLELNLLHNNSAVILGAGPIGREIDSLLKAVGLTTTLVGRSARREMDGTKIESFKQINNLVKEI